MPTNIIDQVLRVTSQGGGSLLSGDSALTNPANEALRALNGQIAGLRSIYQAQTSQAVENTTAIRQNTQSRVVEAGTSAGSVARAAVGSLGGGLSFLPLISGIARLFGSGSDSRDLPPLQEFSLPRPLELEGGIRQNGRSPIESISYGQAGLPRLVSASGNATNVSVNVQAIDSRSFLDHSDAIARAVREAMLNSHAINDVISEI